MYMFNYKLNQFGKYTYSSLPDLFLSMMYFWKRLSTGVIMDILSILSYTDNRCTSAVVRQEHSASVQSSAVKSQEQQSAVRQELNAEELLKGVPPDQLAMQLLSVAIEGLTDEELSDSGGEGMYRERDEFVVKNEDIESLKVSSHILGKKYDPICHICPLCSFRFVFFVCRQLLPFSLVSMRLKPQSFQTTHWFSIRHQLY